MKKKLIMGLTVLTVLTMVSGCSGNKQETSKKKETPTVNIAISAEPKAEQLDATAYDSSMAIYGAVYQPLVEYGEKGVFKPGLAESWEISEDGKKYLFRLDEKAKFSDGSPVDAEAVKFTIERAQLNNETSSLQLLTNLEKIEVNNPSTITFYFNEVSNQILAELSQTRPLRIMSPHSVEGEKASGAFKEPIGSGPFIVKDHSAEHVKMVPNPYFNHEQPVTYQIDFKTIADGSSRTLALKSGEVDIVGGTLGEITDSDSDSFQKDSAYTIEEFEGTMTHFLAFNPDNTTLTATIRAAIERSIDKTLLSEKSLAGLFRENVQYVSETNQPVVAYDLKQATDMFEREGYKKNKAGYYEKEQQELAFDLMIQTTEFPEWKKQAEIVESELKKAGVKVTINILDQEGYYDVLWKTKKFDMIFYRTYTDALLPYNFLNSLYHNTTEGPGVLANDNVLSQELDQFAKTFGDEEQQKLANQFLTRVSQQTLAIQIDYKNEKFVVSNKISSFQYSGLSDSPIDYQKLGVNQND